eukprot:3609231-Rhodomonas_salina.1
MATSSEGKYAPANAIRELSTGLPIDARIELDHARISWYSGYLDCLPGGAEEEEDTSSHDAPCPSWDQQPQSQYRTPPISPYSRTGHRLSAHLSTEHCNLSTEHRLSARISALDTWHSTVR